MHRAKTYGTFKGLFKPSHALGDKPDFNVLSNNDRNHTEASADPTSGYVEFVLDEGGNDAINLSQFRPAGIDNQETTVYYRKIVSTYSMNCTPEEAGFVEPSNKKLGQFMATAISGNDITSSVIYTSGLVAVVAGYFTPLCLLLVVILLYFFRNVYTEVVTALPLNGGTYTGIVNTTRKGVAVFAACLSFLAYAATAVVSATSAINYLQDLVPQLPTVAGTIIIVALFAILMLVGLKESARVALIVFIAHILTLCMLVCAAFGYLIHTKGKILVEHYTGRHPPNVVGAIVMGFAQSTLGISGFESSANFIEHQRTGVYQKTLRNMWILVAFFNPIISLLGFACIPLDSMYENTTTLTVKSDVQDGFLSVMAEEMDDFLGGKLWLQKLVIIDSLIVLSGAVLTAYVGVLGLIKRMVDDDIFPGKLLAKMPLTGSFYPIILFFCGICISLIVITWGDIVSVEGVYTVSFLSVMFLFCLSNLILKHTRKTIRRDVKAKWWTVLFCMTGVTIALIANCVYQPMIVAYAAIYFTIFMAIFYGFYARTFLIRCCILRLTERWKHHPCIARWHQYYLDLLNSTEMNPMVFFSEKLNLHEIKRAVQKLLNNEVCRRLKIVHMYEKIENVPSRDSMINLLYLFKQMYPNLRIDILLLKGKFGPGAIHLIEALLDIPANRMFIVCPATDFPYNIAELGSVRIIMGRREGEES